jgi:hypothetical protein
MSTRAPAVSGAFYPSDANELGTIVSEDIKRAKNFGKNPLLLVSPHAGFVYSGQTAGYAYKQLENLPKAHYTVVLVGPSHHVGFEGFAFPFDDKFVTPLGEIAVNQDKIHKFLSKNTTILPVFKHDIPHKDEHCLETQLPFLQKSLESFDIIPIVYGKSDYNQLCFIFEQFLADDNTIVVISSDLSHFHDYDTAKSIDASCNKAVIDLSIDELSNGEACGMIGIEAAIKFANTHGLKSELLDYKNSGDTAGDKSRVVGYASYMFYSS